MLCTTLVLGVHLATAHHASDATRSHINEANPGLYAKCDTIVVGGYLNTWGRSSLYAAKSFPLIDRVEVLVGGVSGYARKVGPLVTISYRMDDGTRLSFIPSTPQNIGGVHLSHDF